LDPALVTSLEGLRVAAALFEGLTRNDPVTAAPIPGLARSWEISPDGRVQKRCEGCGKAPSMRLCGSLL
jgi:ABC-type oligopeptide transport system substrate-binding subunit